MIRPRIRFPDERFSHSHWPIFTILGDMTHVDKRINPLFGALSGRHPYSDYPEIWFRIPDQILALAQFALSGYSCKIHNNHNSTFRQTVLNWLSCLSITCRVKTSQSGDSLSSHYTQFIVCTSLLTLYSAKAIIVSHPIIWSRYTDHYTEIRWFVHWLLMDGLLHLVQRGGDWPQPTQTFPRCTKYNSPSINSQCTNHRISV